MSKPLNVAVLGATGAVGQEFVRLFEQRDWPINALRLLASERSVGKRQMFKGQELCVELATGEAFEGTDVAFFSAGASRSREFAPHAVKAGAVVIDNSSAFRMDPDVPLVIPEINFDAIKPGTKLVANPNCTAIVLLMAVAPLRSLGRIERIIISSSLARSWMAVSRCPRSFRTSARSTSLVTTLRSTRPATTRRSARSWRSRARSSGTLRCGST
jgi:aspartate-semialdehyde dehydrogenase